VLVDFTADWCVTCQLNKKTSLEIESVVNRLKELNAVALLGDYTLKDPRITAELKRWGRAGVPLVLVYSADAEECHRGYCPSCSRRGLSWKPWKGRNRRRQYPAKQATRTSHEFSSAVLSGRCGRGDR
jgi:hypothetical protein